MMKKIVILEDGPERIERFRLAIDSLELSVEVMCFNNAHRFCTEWEAIAHDISLISLDHDLYPNHENDEDPGDGLMVAKMLAQHSPCCPVIVHSSNAERASQMAGSLELEGWIVHRVPAVGDDWIEIDWIKVVSYVLRS